jgi:hypothetical protein
MTVTTYVGWVNDGRPWKNCQPINDFIATLREHKYTGPGVGIGDLSHLTANPPEDHCPYSHTPWPAPQPYPYVMAIDIMPNEGLDIIELGGRLFDDKSSSVPGTEPIKYLNWTDSDGNCWHDSWMPNHTRFRSTDRGHIHISFRTDYVRSAIMATYDPYGDDMGLTNDEYNMIRNTGFLVTGIVNMEDPIVVPPNPESSYPGASIPNKLAQAIRALQAGEPAPGIPDHTHPGGTTGLPEPVA